MTSSFKRRMFTVILGSLAVACSQSIDSPEKVMSDDKTQASAAPKPEVMPAKQEAAPGNRKAADGNKDNSPCTEVFLTGTGGGPASQFGNAQSGVFIRSGHSGNGCNDVRLQFDAGRGTLLKLSSLPAPTRPGFITPTSLSALFLTHGHSDHTSSVPDILETRWIMTKNDGQFPDLKPPKPKYKDFPVICFDATCGVVSIALSPWKEEIDSRAEKDHRLVKPKADLRKFQATASPQTVWESSDVRVSAVSVSHIPGSVGYQVQTPAGEVCISGDTSYSDNFKTMCEGADVIIHEVIHPVLDGIAEKLPNPDPTFTKVMDNIFNSHTSTADFDKLGGTDAVMVLTHIIPPIGAGGFQGIPLVPHLNKLNPARGKGPTKPYDFCKAIQDSGFEGQLHVGRDLMQIKLSNGKVSTKMPEDQPTDCAKFLGK